MSFCLSISFSIGMDFWRKIFTDLLLTIPTIIIGTNDKRDHASYGNNMASTKPITIAMTIHIK